MSSEQEQMKILVLYSKHELLPFSDLSGKDADFVVESTTSNKEASEKIHLYEYDCILLFSDFDHPEVQELFHEIAHSNKNSGLIFLSKEITVEQKVKALNAGADDCLIQPVHPDELKARIHAIVRRKKFNARHQIHFANLVIDLDQKQVLVWNTPISVTPKEYEILLYLIMNQKKTVSPTMLSEYLWGESSEEKESNNLLMTHIKNLRKKLKQAKAELEIKNIYAVGYQMVEL
ncbi:MAG: basR [Chitinophagaceae bacterium]|nr:basR [Chitinophagaceae bacterium]